jgi:ATP-dependent Clp protease ATP-binding subunit ClpA
MIDEAGSMIKQNEDEESCYVTEDAIQTVVSEITGIPVGKLDTGEKSRLSNLEIEIGKRIKGQNPAVRAVSKAIRRARSGMRDGKRPISSLLFCGPTGVGKVRNEKRKRKNVTDSIYDLDTMVLTLSFFMSLLLLRLNSVSLLPRLISEKKRI